MPGRLGFLADAQPVLPGVGRLLADLLQDVGPDRHREGRLPPRQQGPLVADQVILGPQPSAVLRADLAGEVGQVDEVVEVKGGIAQARAERGEVMAGLGLHLGRLLGLQLQMRDDIEPDLHLVLLAPFLELPLQLLVGVGHEAGDGEEGELAGLRQGGRLAQREHRAQAAGGAGRALQELPAALAPRTAGRRCHHDFPPFAVPYLIAPEVRPET